jgi:hypothetical protein
MIWNVGESHYIISARFVFLIIDMKTEYTRVPYWHTGARTHGLASRVRLQSTQARSQIFASLGVHTYPGMEGGIWKTCRRN